MSNANKNSDTLTPEQIQEMLSEAKAMRDEAVAALAQMKEMNENVVSPTSTGPNSEVAAILAGIKKNEEYKNILTEEKKETEQKINQLLQDQEFFLTTSEQNKILLSTDFEEYKKRYDYQRSEAKESYYNIVSKYNTILEKIEAELYEKYNEEKNIYLNDNADLLNKLNSLIQKKTKELNKVTTELNNERTAMKERKHTENSE